MVEGEGREGSQGEAVSGDARRASSRRGRRASRPSMEYDVPDSYQNLDELAGPPPVQNPDENVFRRVSAREDDLGAADAAVRPSGAPRRLSRARRRSSAARVDYEMPETYANLDELGPSPVQNPDENPIYRHRSLEEDCSRDQALIGSRETGGETGEPPAGAAKRGQRVSRLATEVYVVSYLVFFAMLGTLARLGLQALTTYAGSPVVFSSVWPNFAGSLVMGYLAEDRMLFRLEPEARQPRPDEEGGSGSGRAGDPIKAADAAAARKAHLAMKKTIPLYVGLATGFCGSFTSFSSFIRDLFLALSNDLPVPGADAGPVLARSGGQSFLALLAVAVATVALSLSGLFVGAHLAIGLELLTPPLPYLFTRRVVDRSAVLLGWGCWAGAVVLSVVPPNPAWRGRVTLALVFAPLGCLARFYASIRLNGKVAAFPLGTFAVNVLGTAVLGMSWDLAHVPLGGVVGCQVLQGVEDGFCGCLTTVSTWVAELATLRRRHAYLYGSASVLVSFAIMVAVMGGLRWSHGFDSLACVH